MMDPNQESGWAVIRSGLKCGQGEHKVRPYGLDERPSCVGDQQKNVCGMMMHPRFNQTPLACV